MNTFHQAGLLISGATKGIPRVEELLNASKNPKRIFYRLKSGVIETHKSQFHSMLSLDPQARSSHVWDIYSVLGIEAARDYLLHELVSETTDIHVNHLSVLVDKMLFTGEIRPVNQHSMKKDSIGVFAKASFEETDNTDGLSASIVCGKKIQILNIFCLKFPRRRWCDSLQLIQRRHFRPVPIQVSYIGFDDRTDDMSFNMSTCIT